MISVLCTWHLTASMVNDADGVIYVKLTVKIVNYAVNRQSLVTLTPLFTIVTYSAIFEWRRMCTTLNDMHWYAQVWGLWLLTMWRCDMHRFDEMICTCMMACNNLHWYAQVWRDDMHRFDEMICTGMACNDMHRFDYVHCSRCDGEHSSRCDACIAMVCWCDCSRCDGVLCSRCDGVHCSRCDGVHCSRCDGVHCSRTSD